MPNLDSTTFQIIGALESLPEEVKLKIEEQIKQSGNASTGVIQRNNAQKVSSTFILPDVRVKTRRVSVGTTDPMVCLGVGLICALCGIVMAFVVNYE